MGETTDQRRVVEEFVERLKKNMRVTAVFFFGSRAQGTFDRWSDFDLLIVSGDFEGKDFFERWALVQPHWMAKAPGEFFCYTPGEYEELREEISVPGEAIRHGLRVF